ncbi:MAG: hypothetical protein R3A12_00760 [Ignavibacteria bacterium]
MKFQDLSFDLSTMVFDNANQWLSESLETIFKITDVNWIVRVHPGEKVSGSLYTNDDFIKEHYKEIPGHVKILWSDSEINSLGHKLIDVGITLFGTNGSRTSGSRKARRIRRRGSFLGKRIYYRCQD